jgi:hypothetical protein
MLAASCNGVADCRLFMRWPTRYLDFVGLIKFLLSPGRGDQVQCFYCDGGLKNWDPEDVPCEEHARWFGECGFLRLLKGPEYVEGIRLARPPNREYLLQEDPIDFNGILAQANSSAGRNLSRERAEVPATAMTPAAATPVVPTTLATAAVDTAASSNRDRRNSGIDSGFQERRPPPISENDEAVLRENRRLRDERLCKICADHEVGVVFIPCGHFATCVHCAPAFTDCPVCRTRIDSAVRTFLS